MKVIPLYGDPILGWADLPMVLCMICTHGFGRNGFQCMVLDAMVFGPWYWMLRHVKICIVTLKGT